MGSVLSKAAKVSIASIETNGPLTNRMTFTSPEGDVQVRAAQAVAEVHVALAIFEDL